MRRMEVELRAVRPFQTCAMARDFDHGTLHPQTDPKVGDPLFPRVLDRLDLALNPPCPEAPWHEDPIGSFEERVASFFIDVLRIDVFEMDFGVIGDPGMDESLGQAFVRLTQAHIFPHNRNRRLQAGMFYFLDDPLPTP